MSLLDSVNPLKSGIRG